METWKEPSFHSSVAAAEIRTSDTDDFFQTSTASDKLLTAADNQPPSSSSSSSSSPEDFIEFHIATWLWVYASPILLIVGTTGNALSLAVLRSRTFRKSSISFTLSALAVVDTGVLYTSLLRQWLIYVSDDGLELRNVAGMVGCKTHFFLTYFLSHLSSWTIVVVTVERTLSVGQPILAKVVCSRSRVALLWMSIASLLAIINVHFFITATYPLAEGRAHDVIDVNSTTTTSTAEFICYILPGYRPFFARVWYWVDFALLAFVPFFVVLTGNSIIAVCVVRAVQFRQRHQRHEQQKSTSTASTSNTVVAATSAQQKTSPVGVGGAAHLGQNSAADGATLCQPRQLLLNQASTQNHRASSSSVGVSPTVANSRSSGDKAADGDSQGGIERRSGIGSNDDVGSELLSSDVSCVSGDKDAVGTSRNSTGAGYFLRCWKYRCGAVAADASSSGDNRSPIVTSVAGNFLRRFRRKNHRHDHPEDAVSGSGSGDKAAVVTSSTVMLTSLSFVFLLTTAPNVVYFLKLDDWLASGVDSRTEARIRLGFAVTNLLYYTNNAANFLLYCLTGSRFRRAMCDLFRRRGRARTPTPTAAFASHAAAKRQQAGANGAGRNSLPTMTRSSNNLDIVRC